MKFCFCELWSRSQGTAVPTLASRSALGFSPRQTQARASLADQAASMTDNTFIALIIGGIIVTSVCALVKNQSQCYGSEETGASLRAPLLQCVLGCRDVGAEVNPCSVGVHVCVCGSRRGQHRIEAASRDADGGFKRCRQCGFDNFKRLRFCCLCGDKVFEELRHTDARRPLPVWAALSQRQKRARYAARTNARPTEGRC